jgi:two-component system NtrC family sensor kinase
MHRWIPFYLNIRQKVIIALTISMLLIAAIAGISFRYLREIELKQHFVEVADDLSNIILEIRRYEKNYLLYGSLDDLQENHRFVQEGMQVFQKILPEIKDLKAGPQLSRMQQELITYSGLMEQLRIQGVYKVEEQLRESGKALLDLSHQLVKFERHRILVIIRTLKTQLLSSVGVFLVLGGFLVPIVVHKIMRPLKVIEHTTLRIAQGNFTPVPVLDTRDETQQVVEAFNRMVAELEKRQDQLVQAKKLSSLGILTSGIAHQLNNPLNNISTSCQILLEELDQADREFLHKMLTNVEQEVHRARDIVKGLLEFSRVREFSLAPTSLSDVIKRSVSLISSQVPPGVEITRDVPADLVLNLDGPRMQQVFLNLLMNAIHAIENPPGEIKITAMKDYDGRHAVVSVEDTGIGIAQKDIGRIFDPFFTTKEVGAGTGLGLSIAYGIIQKHQGSISVESHEGEGTRFLIRLPLLSAV